VRVDCAKRDHATDLVLLVCVVVLAIATWAAISGADRVVAWEHCLAVSVTMFLALAAVTPHQACAIAMRLAISGWLMAAPWLLDFAQMTAARWAYWIAGSIIAALSAPGLLPRDYFRPIKAAGSAAMDKGAGAVASLQDG